MKDKYLLFCCEDGQTMRTWVNERMKEGYRLCGDLKVIPTEESGILYKCLIREMVKEQKGYFIMSWPEAIAYSVFAVVAGLIIITALKNI